MKYPAQTLSNNQPKILNTNWIQLLEYGEYPHASGLQIVTYDHCLNMQKKFNSLRNILSRKFGGLPVFIGHPDDPSFSGQPGHTDTRSYGWITRIEARKDGLWILPKWSKSGEEIVKNAHYKYMSARWEMKEINENEYAPTKLISVGLTNHPNIPCNAISNQKNEESQTPKTHATSLNLKTQSVTSHLKSNTFQENPRDQFIQLVKQRMLKENINYSQAWSLEKSNNPDIFDAITKNI